MLNVKSSFRKSIRHSQTQNAFRCIIFDFHMHSTARTFKNIYINCINKLKCPLLQETSISDIHIRCASIFSTSSSSTQNSVNCFYFIKAASKKKLYI